MAAPRRNMEKGVAKPAAPDYQEQLALDRAGEALARFSPGLTSPRTLAAVAISEWIVARTATAAATRFNAELLFDLQNARLRGFVEAALPTIGGSLAELPADVPLFSLTKDQIVDVIVAGILGAQEAAVSANESLGFPFREGGGVVAARQPAHATPFTADLDDEIPF